MSRSLATFTVEGERYGVDVLRVQAALRAPARTPVPLAPAGVAGLVNLRGEVVLAIDPRVALGLDPVPEGTAQMMVVVRVDDELVSLLVDAVGDVVEVLDEDEAGPPDTLPAALRAVIRGVHVLPTGLLLDLDLARVTATGA